MIMGSSAKDTKSSIQQYDTKVPTSVPGAEVRDVDGDSSESDGETEPAKSFHRRISTNKEIKCSVSTKEGYLMKQTSSFQRWRRRYFKLKGRKLYYAKDTKNLPHSIIRRGRKSFKSLPLKETGEEFPQNNALRVAAFINTSLTLVIYQPLLCNDICINVFLSRK